MRLQTDAEIQAMLFPQRKKRTDSFPWTLSDEQTSFVRRRCTEWHVTETVGQRAAVCRACGGDIPKNTPRLTFTRCNGAGIVLKQGHIHVDACAKSPALIEHEEGLQIEKEVTAFQEQLVREEFPEFAETPTVLNEATIAKGASLMVYPKARRHYDP